MDDGLKDFIQELRDYGNARRGELAGMMLEAANRLEVFYNARKCVHKEACLGIAWQKALDATDKTDDVILAKSYVCGLAFAEGLMHGDIAVGLFSAYGNVELNAIHTEDSLRPLA